MAWTVKVGPHQTKAMVDSTDRTWVPVSWVAAVLGRKIQIDEKAAEIHLMPAAHLPELPAMPVGAGVEAWRPVRPVIVSTHAQRTAELLDLCIQQFRVKVNPRYQPSPATYCNIFVWDVATACSVPLPHWAYPDGSPADVGARDADELDANELVLWLRRPGAARGWQECDAAAAQSAAAAGKPAVVCWYNPGGVGHIAWVRPGQADPRRGVCIAQAGATNFDDGYLTDGFGARGPLEFYQHD